MIIESNAAGQPKPSVKLNTTLPVSKFVVIESFKPPVPADHV